MLSFSLLNTRQTKGITFEEFYGFLIKDADSKRLVFKPGEKMKLKEAHSVVL